jgi:hypothetical protein
VGPARFGHGQIASLGDPQRYFDTLDVNEPPSIRYRDEKVDVETVVKAFMAVRNARGDNGSSDLYVADPNRNAVFIHECRRHGIKASEYSINKKLFYARKNGYLKGLDSDRTSINYERQAFACEFAATELRYKLGATVDDILCDPGTATEFDSIAGRITPGLTPLEYRWAILGIRKAAGRSVKEVLPAGYKMPAFSHSFRLVTDAINRVPDTSGIYLLFERQRLLYTRATEDLRMGLELHRAPTVLGAITEKLWKPKPENFIVNYEVIEEKKAFLHAVEKRLVDERHPLFNVSRSAA